MTLTSKEYGFPIHATLESIHLNKSINYKDTINNLVNKCILFQYVVLSNVKNMIFNTWNVVSTLYHACIMSYIGFMNGIKKVNKANHSKALSLLVYILDTRFLIYYQYLYGAIDVDGP